MKEIVSGVVSSFSYSEEYASGINNFISEKTVPFNFIFEDDNVFICSDKKVQYIKSYSADTFKNTATFDLSTASDLSYYSGTSKTTFETTNVLRGDVITTQLAIAPWNQGETGLCWAGTVEAIGEYVAKDYSYTPQEIAEAMGVGENEGAKVEIANDALSELYDLNSIIYGGVTSFSFIASRINAGKPMYMDFQTKTKGHAVTLIGYGATSSKYYIRIMDTYGGQYTTLEYIDSSVQLPVGTSIYTWDDTIYIS